MPSIRRSILIIAYAVAAAGCGTAATVIEPSALRAPTVDRTLRLDQDYSFETPPLGGINNVVARVTILSGSYRAQYEDAGGVYFIGPKGCYRTVNLNSDAPGLLADCGIYLPNAKGLPKMYVYRNEPSPTLVVQPITPKPTVATSAGAAIGGGIVNAMVAADQDKPRFLGEKFQPADPEFRAKLKAE